MFVGKVEGLPKGWWVGVKFDEPVGKNDGTVKGKRFFECAGWVRVLPATQQRHRGGLPGGGGRSVRGGEDENLAPIVLVQVVPTHAHYFPRTSSSRPPDRREFPV